MTKFRNEDQATRVASRRTKRVKPVLSRRARRDVKAIVNNTLKEKVEVKSFDVNESLVAIEPSTGTPWVYRLDQITQGDGEHQRIGAKINPTYLGFRGALRNDASGVDCQVRVMVVQWMQGNSVAPTASSLLENPAYPFSFRQRNNDSQYKVLYDQKVLLSTSPGNPSHQVLIKADIDGKNISPIEFNDSSTLNGDNFIYAFAISDTTSLNAPYLDHLTFRLRYTDM